MYSDEQRTVDLLNNALKEMELVSEMSEPIKRPNDFGTSLQGMTIFRACSMSLQYITESFVKIRNIQGECFLFQYKGVPWKKVFGMRNFLAHEYVEVDEEAIFFTIKEDLPKLYQTTKRMLDDIQIVK